MKILITGAKGGIGYLTALTLAEKGHKVYLTCHTNKQLKKVKEKIGKQKNITVLKLDITSEKDRLRVLDLDIDCLFNNAAVALGGSIIEADMDYVRENFEVNVFSSFRLLQIVLRNMIEKNKGRIIVMSSLASMFPIPFSGVYSATKASITSITKSLQKELSFIKFNVKVILIEPGLYHTGFNQVYLNNKYDDGKYFKDVKEKLKKMENFAFKMAEKKSLDSIVVQIVRAIEDKHPKSVYRAPKQEAFLAKLYSIFK